MSRNNANSKLLEKGGILAMVQKDILERIEAFGDYCLEFFAGSAQWYNLTGNTITSLGYGIFQDGLLLKAATMNSEGIKTSAICTKLTKGDVFYGMTYDGDLIKPQDAYVPDVQTDQQYGSDSTFDWLANGKVKLSAMQDRGYCIMFTTGTEYSVYNDAISESMHGNRSFTQNTFAKFLKSFKPI